MGYTVLVENGLRAFSIRLQQEHSTVVGARIGCEVQRATIDR